MRKHTYVADARESVEWGEEGICEIVRLGNEYFSRGAYSFFNVSLVDTGEEAYILWLTEQIPRSITRRSKETLEHLRGSLDQSIYAARRCLLSNPRDEVVTFPLATDPLDLERRLRNPAIPPELHQHIRAFEPYYRGPSHEGGDDIIRSLSRLASRRKHTVHLSVIPRTETIRIGSIDDITGHVTVGGRWDAAASEIEVLRCTRGTRVDDLSVATTIAFDEKPPLDGAQLVWCLSLLLHKVRAFVEAVDAEVASRQ